MEQRLALGMAVTALLLVIGVLASRLSSRLNMPVLLLFLGVGILFKLVFGFDPSVGFANGLGTIAMAFILYSGGLETRVRNIRKIFVPGLLLSTAGVFFTAALLGTGAHFILGWSWEWSFLLGSIISSTDAAAVFAILRSRAVSLKGDLASVLEFESGSNDPMAALLTIFMASYLQNPDTVSLWNIVWEFPAKMLIGVFAGIYIGKFSCWLFNRVKFDYEGLYFVLGLAVVLATYSITSALFGNGFMAVYCAGITMGNRRFNFKQSQIRYNNGLAWLMQVAMFAVLGMLVNWQDLAAVPAGGFFQMTLVQGLLLALVLMFVARPAAVFLCLLKSKFSTRERVLISWVGLRGAAPIVLATFPLAMMLKGNPAVFESAGTLFNLIFCMVVVSVLLQGWTLMPLARFLKLALPFRDKSRSPLELEETGAMDSVMHEFEVIESSPCVDKTLAELKMPAGALVMLVRREGKFIMAHGNTKVLLNDGLLIMGSRSLLHELAHQYFPGNEFFDN